MKYLLYFLISILIHSNANGQISKTDSLKLLLERSPDDTNRVNLLLDLGNSYYFFKPDTSIIYSKMALKLAKELHYTNGIIIALNLAGEASRLLGDYPGSLKLQLEAYDLNRKIKNPAGEAISLGFIGVTYNELKEYRQGLQYLLPANTINQNLPVNQMTVFILTNIGIAYNFLKIPDSALYYLRIANYKVNDISHPQLRSLIPLNIGNVYRDLGNKDSALTYYYRALHNSRISNESINIGRVQQKIAELYESEHQYDSSLFYARHAFADANRTSQKVNILESSSLLVKLHRQSHQLDSALYFEDIASAMKESLYGREKFKQLQLLMLDEQKQQQEALQQEEQFRNKIKYTILFISTGVFLLISFILYRTNLQRKKAAVKIEKAYTELKDTQAQLVQREKMASLGELTAGIAHEIQNPLNFVNNFSEVNKELLIELNEEIEKGNMEEIKALAKDLIGNEEKIIHHGKRADAIVKGMLQHSRSSSGLKELTDINALADEYLRLAYHGIRAKDKSFNAILKTDFDERIGKINIVPQEMGIVFLNLFNNAFYAVSETQQMESIKQKAQGNYYEPTITVSTKKTGTHIFVSVKDNGSGIPQKVLDKIFQPFFTTKPTGKGTGLGLSLSYDIIKTHGGEIKVNTMENKGSEFVITLPI